MSAPDLAIYHVQFPSRLFASQADCDQLVAMAHSEGVAITVSRERRRFVGTQQVVRFERTPRTTRRGDELLNTLYDQIAPLL